MAGPGQPRKKKAAPDAAELREPLSAEELRRQAEERLDELSAAAPAPEKLTAAVHELRVHQIELDMQNEELRRAQLELDALRAKYSDLFHLAPVGYFTLSEKGIVGEANLTAALLLGVERRRLVGLPFSAFIVAGDRDAYYRRLELLKQTQKPQTCELRLQPVGGEPFWAHLDGRPQRAADCSGEPRRYNLTFTDVDERVLAEMTLRQREEQLDSAVEGSGVGLWDWYPQTGEETFNERWAEILGYTLAELAPTSIETWRSLCHPDDLQRSNELLEQHFSGQSPLYECETRMRHKDGHWVWVLGRGKVSQRDADGRPLRMTGTHLDVTERKQAEEALRASTALLSGLLTSIPDIVFFKDEQGVYLGCNPEFARYVGRDAAGIVGATDHELFGKEIADSFREQDRIMMAGGEPRHNEEWIQYPDGARILIDTLKAPLKDVGGQVIGVLGVSRDVTARKRAEEALRESEERLGDITFSMADWVWETDENGVYTYSSQQGLDLLGRSREDVIGKTPFDFMPPDEAQRVAAIFSEIVAQKAPIEDLENWNIAKNGERLCLLTNGVPMLDKGGDLKGYRGVDKDITARKQAEEALRDATDRLALATRAGGVGLWDYDPVNDTLTWDDQMFALYGITREQFGGAYEAWQAGLHPDDRQRGDAEIQMALRGEKEFDTELRVLWPDGAIHYVRALALVQRDASGRPTHMIGTNWDITAQKRIEGALRSSEENFRTFFETVEDVIVVATPEGRIVYANPALSAKLGYTATEVKALHVLDLNPSDRRAEAEAIFAAMLQGERESCSLPLQSKAGALVPAETRVWFGQWDGEECIFGVSKDLTKEQEALQRFERLFHGNPVLTAVSSLQEGRFIEVNEAFLSTLGYSRDEILGHTTEELNLFVEPEQQRAVAEQMQAQGRASDCELKVRCKDGAILEGLFSGEIIESQGRQYFLTVMIDQTERKRAEDALRRSEHALQSALDGLASSIAVLDERGTILLVNKRWREFAEQNGLAAASVCEGANYLQVCDAVTGEHSEEAARFAAGIRAVVAGEKDSSTMDYPCDAPDEKRWFTGRVTVFPGEGPHRVVVAHEDITARKQAEESLRDATDRLALATRAGGVGLWDYLVTDDVLTWDDQMFALYGVTREQFGGAYEAWQAGLHPDDRERGDAETQMALRGEKEFDTELRVLWPDGAIHYVRALAIVQRDASGRPTHMIGTNWDITAQRRAQAQIQQRNQALSDINVEQLRYNDELVGESAILEAANAAITKIAATDVLTGLANRRHFYEVLEKAVSLARRHGAPLSLVSLDLDGLKRVNDSAGHEAGDEVLASFAALLAALCRAEDLPARLGGDEFSVLLPSMELAGALGLAERLLAAVRACAALEQRGVTVSAGVAQWTPDELLDELLRRADEALYAAKRGGGDAVAGAR